MKVQFRGRQGIKVTNQKQGGTWKIPSGIWRKHVQLLAGDEEESGKCWWPLRYFWNADIQRETLLCGRIV